jgi:uncharacterized membrane protein YeaQ/YmgE (transglycosylase-associated protein family)
MSRAGCRTAQVSFRYGRSICVGNRGLTAKPATHICLIGSFGDVGWVEPSEAHRRVPSGTSRWVSLRSTHPTELLRHCRTDRFQRIAEAGDDPSLADRPNALSVCRRPQVGWCKSAFRISRGQTMHLSNESLLVIVLVGLVAGWLAGQVMRGSGFGLVGDLIVGLLGALIGDWLLPRLNIHLGVGIVALIINAFVGAIVLLFILRLIGGGGWRFGRWRRRW